RGQHRYQPLQDHLVVVDEEEPDGPGARHLGCRAGRGGGVDRLFHPGILPPFGPHDIPQRGPQAGGRRRAAASLPCGGMPEKQMAIQRAWQRGVGGARPIMVGIAGDSASGKTTLTQGLVEALGPDRITAICVDDYHRYDRVERKGLPFTPLHPACNYVDVMEQHMQLLALGQPVLKPVYNHRTGTLDRPVLVEPSEFVIAEGLLPLHTRLARACFDVTVYLDPPEIIRRRWKVQRDTSKRGYTDEEVSAELVRREPESAAYIRPQRAHADIVVRFAPIEERGETPDDPLSAYVLLRPTIAHPDL